MKKLKIGLRKTGGRNNRGRITTRHRGGGHKRLYRILDCQEEGHKIEASGTVIRVEYDPNRTARIAYCKGYNREFYKVLGGKVESQVASIGQKGFENWEGKEIKVIKIKDVPVGEEVYNVSQRPGQGGKIGRATGTNCLILKQEEKITVIRMPSSEVKRINNENTCILGKVASEERKRLGKAGASRRRGIRPTVKGVVMNAVDHPNGGKTAGGIPKTLWGKLAKWVPTRKKMVRK